jgi:hypothetical protein
MKLSQGSADSYCSGNNKQQCRTISMSVANNTEEVAPGYAQGNNSSGVDLMERAYAFKEVLASRPFLLATVFTAVAYLSFFKYLDFATGTPVMAAASYFVLFYLLIAVSSVLMGLNVYSLRSKLSAGKRNTAKTNAAAGSSSAAMSLVGGVISCSCHTSLLLPMISFLGLSAISGIGVIGALVEYQLWILVVSIAVDLYLVYRILGRLRGVP